MSGTVGPRISPLINTYSLDFDGVDDYVDCGLSTFTSGDDITVSLWVKKSGSGVPICWSNGANNFVIWFNVNTLVISCGQTAASSIRLDYVFNNTTWYNIVIVGAINSGFPTAYINGSVASTKALGSWISANQASSRLGGLVSHTNFDFTGNIDEVCILDRIATPTEIASIYNLGTPENLTSLNPIAWYRMGDNGVYKDPQWLIPSNENKDKVSNYSMDFGGVSDYIDCGVISSLQSVTQYSMTCWFKTSNINQPQGILKWWNGTGQWIELSIYISNQLLLLPSSVSGYGLSASGLISNDIWYNLVAVFDGTLTGNSNRAKLYLNGVELTLNFSGTIATSTTPMTAGTFKIGERYLGNAYFLGNIDEAAIFNYPLTQQNATDIYNLGVPTDLTTLNPVTYWKMGENATFAGGVWTVPDEVGSNDGTSVNMDILNRTAESPNTTNNALSFNMDLIDRVEDTPPT